MRVQVLQTDVIPPLAHSRPVLALPEQRSLDLPLNSTLLQWSRGPHTGIYFIVIPHPHAIDQDPTASIPPVCCVAKQPLAPGPAGHRAMRCLFVQSSRCGRGRSPASAARSVRICGACRAPLLPSPGDGLCRCPLLWWPGAHTAAEQASPRGSPSVLSAPQRAAPSTHRHPLTPRPACRRPWTPAHGARSSRARAQTWRA